MVGKASRVGWTGGGRSVGVGWAGGGRSARGVVDIIGSGMGGGGGGGSSNKARVSTLKVYSFLRLWKSVL